MKTFDYLFFRVCEFFTKKGDTSAEISATMVVSLLQFFALLILLIVCRLLFNTIVPETFNKYWFLPFIIIIFIINWFKYNKRHVYKDLRDLWKDENRKSRKIKSLLIVLISMLLFFTPILYGFITQNIIGGKSFWE